MRKILVISCMVLSLVFLSACFQNSYPSQPIITDDDLGEKDIMGFTDYRGKSDLFDSERTFWNVVFDELTDGELKTINGNEIEKFPSKFQETKYIVLERTTKKKEVK